ncbi:MAG: hypothetical protein BMS9Abin37_0252 [Acidobacteriota bacterium]|nr:MAG: hypothetical protein BMS9Abin37_0252 [Acidobacteriota bacterium]
MGRLAFCLSRIESASRSDGTYPNDRTEKGAPHVLRCPAQMKEAWAPALPDRIFRKHSVGASRGRMLNGMVLRAVGRTTDHARLRATCIDALVGLVLLVPSGAAKERVEQAPGPRPVLRVGRLPSDLRLDGVLDEPAWDEADQIDGLTMVEPEEGIPGRATTRVQVLADAATLVIGIVCEDPDPSAIVSFSKSRDARFEREDHVRLVLDPFLDERTGEVFAVNPEGSRYDALIASRGQRNNPDWDAVWEAATARGSYGWSVEIRIPTRSLKFNADLRSWGFNVQRRIERWQETDRWAGARRDWALTQTSHSGLLTNLPRFELGLGLDVRPSLVGGGGRTGVGGITTTEATASLDVTKLLGANLLALLTINTDFAETEVDTRQVNLTRFPLFFPEKRTFFLDGADIFEFGIGLRRNLIPFFPRRIGLLKGREVPLLVGGKINGRVGRNNVGALMVRTGEVPGLVGATNLGVVRVQRNLFAESSVGMLATFGDPQGRSGSWMLGADFTYQTSHFRGDKNFLVGVWGLGLDRDDLLEGDRSALGFAVDYPNDLWDVSLTYRRIGDAFDPSLGFVLRPGTNSLSLGVNYQPRPDWSWVRQMFYESRLSVVTNLDGVWESYRAFTAPVNWRLESGDRFEFNVVPQGERLVVPFEIAEGVVIPPGTYEFRRFRLEGGLAAKRRFGGQLTWWFGDFFDGTLSQLQWEGTWRPNSLIIVEFSGEHNVGDLPAGRFTQDLIGTRLRVNLSPDLTVSSFVQYDNESESFGSNTRLRWTFDPLGDVFVIYNYNVKDLGNRFVTDANQLLVKLVYTLRR